ncbi:hypothetical protein KW797_04110 [Candidatus Parcubacteria bacterium]|nr:hypothetical protein [Candidatus Parcubacteria bacterium]
MFPGTLRTHIALLSAIFFFAFLLNSAPYFLAGIPPAYRQSSDAAVHMVNWQEFSKDYAGNFEHDTMFQAFPGVPSGVLASEKILVRISEALGIPLLEFGAGISWLSLALFLAGVYFVVLYPTKNRLLSFLISLVSVVPVISLGLSGWGFLTLGFVPKEISVGISVWLTLLYLRGAETDSNKRIVWCFALLGLFANWYPPVFFHYAAVLLAAEVMRARSLRKEHILYGLVFLLTAPVALYDIFVRGGHLTAPIISIVMEYYGAPLHSLSYLFVHYLRKQVVYMVLVGGLWYLYRRVRTMEYPPVMRIWYFLWWSTLLWSLVGVGIEVFAPLYMKYLISRISVWFYFSSMVIVAFTGYELWRARFGGSAMQKIIFSAVLLIVLFGQTSILSVYTGIRGEIAESGDYRQYLSVVTRLSSFVPPSSLVFANPDRGAATIRTYGGVGVYVAKKDAIVTLYDGASAAAWEARYKETQEVFATKDFSAIRAYALAHGLEYYFFSTKDIDKGAASLESMTVLKEGDYGLAKLTAKQ